MTSDHEILQLTLSESGSQRDCSLQSHLERPSRIRHADRISGPQRNLFPEWQNQKCLEKENSPHFFHGVFLSNHLKTKRFVFNFFFVCVCDCELMYVSIGACKDQTSIEE